MKTHNQIKNVGSIDCSGISFEIHDASHEGALLNNKSIEFKVKPINFKGVIYAILWNILWSFGPLLLGIAYRYTNVRAYEIVYWKAIIMNVLNYFLCKYYTVLFPAEINGKSVTVDIIGLPKDVRLAATIRAIIGAIALWWYFGGTMYLSISKCNILFFTGPLYVPFMAYYFLGEPISKIDIFALTMGFIGMMLINNPFTDHEIGENELLGVALSLTGGVTSSIAWVAIRKMSSKCHFTVAPFYFSLGWTVVGSFLYIFSVQGQTNEVEYSSLALSLLITIGLITFIGQLLQALAYEYEKASRVAVFYYLQTFLVFLYDYFFFGTTYGVIELIGAFLIIGWNLIVGVMKFMGMLED